MTLPSLETFQFCAATSGYRIIRLSIELFLIEHTVNAGYSVATAGLLFLVGNICDVVCNIIFLNYPYLFLGSKIGSALFVIGSPILIVSGYVGFFLSTNNSSLIQMAVCIGLCGIGISSWYVNYKTLYSTAYSKQSMGQVAQLRQGFESIGFLFPSICLAIVSISKNQQQQQEEEDFIIINNYSPNNMDSSSLNIITRTALVLAGLASIFFIISMQIMYKFACQVGCTTETALHDDKERQQQSVWKSIKTFFTTSVLHFFFINTVILALFNVLFGTLSTVSSMYFALDPTDLWVAAIGFPIGGIISAVIALTLGSFKADKRFMLSTSGLVVLFVVMACTIEPASTFFATNGKESTSKAVFFMFGTIVGILCSEAWTVSFALWLKNLNSYPQSFINQANALGNMGDKLLMALIFQGQTLALDRAMDHDGDDEVKPNLKVVGIVLFVPFIILIGISTILVFLRPTGSFDMSILSVNGKARLPFITRLCCRFVSFVSGISFETILFGAFSAFRLSSFGKHLVKDVEFQNVVHVDLQKDDTKKKWTLSVNDLQEYLNIITANNNNSSSSYSNINNNNNNEEEWFVSKENVKLHRVLFDNHDALEARLDMIDKAKHSIWILTWSLDGLVFDILADKLIQKYKKDGTQIKILVDRSLVYYEAERSMATGVLVKCFETLARLSRSGIDVRMQETWYDGDGTSKKPDYCIGLHRKMVLVDNQWMLTGGRNTNDKYVGEPTGFHYVDLEVLLSGNFENFTLPLIQRLWNNSTNVASAIQHDLVKPNKSDPHELTQPDVESQIQAEQLPYNDGNNDNSVSLVQLDHKGGNKFGNDIILSSLVFMIETAEHSVDLAFGMFHLFPPLEEALERAVKRGVRVRLFTNSPQSNNIWHMSGEVMAIAMHKLVKFGVEIYVPKNRDTSSSIINDNNNNCADDGKNCHLPFCLHYKFATADDRCALVGSWNCFGTSVFYDSDYAVVMFDNNNNDKSTSSVSTGKLQKYLEEQLNRGEMIRMHQGPPVPKLPLLFGLLVDETAYRIAKRGY